MSWWEFRGFGEFCKGLHMPFSDGLIFDSYLHNGLTKLYNAVRLSTHTTLQ